MRFMTRKSVAVWCGANQCCDQMSTWWPFGKKHQEEQIDALLRDLLSHSMEGSAETLPTYRKFKDITTVDERMYMLLEISKQIEEK